jgi:hypothetical protein
MCSKLRFLVGVAVAVISLNAITAKAGIIWRPNEGMTLALARDRMENPPQILAQLTAALALPFGLSLFKEPIFEPRSDDFKIGYPRMYPNWWPPDLMCTFLVILYFVPTLVASSRRHPNEEAIGVVNLLLGWTIIGWIACLIWAMRTSSERNRRW